MYGPVRFVAVAYSMYFVVSFFGKAWYVEPIFTMNVSMWLAPMPESGTGELHAVSAELVARMR